MIPDGSVAAALVRWMMFVALAGLMGGLVLDAWVLPHADALTSARRRLTSWSWLWILALALTTLVELVLRTQTMTGGGLGDAVRGLPTVLARTHFGTLWIVRGLLLGLVAVLIATHGRHARVIAIAATLGIAATRSLTAHAADWGDVSLPVLADWLHVVTSIVWAGGLFGLAAVLTTVRGEWPASATDAIVGRFSRLAGVCVVGIVVTAGYAVWVEVPSATTLWQTVYGRWLIFKVAAVAVVLGLGAVNRYVYLPRLSRGTTRQRLFRAIGGEAMLVIVVFGCAAMLTESTPARHAHHHHVSHHEDAPPLRR
jgi:putative copper export protein